MLNAAFDLDDESEVERGDFMVKSVLIGFRGMHMQ